MIWIFRKKREGCVVPWGLPLRLSEGSVSLDVIHELSLEQPETPDFAALDLSGD